MPNSNPYQRHYESGDRAPKISILRIASIIALGVLGLAGAVMAGQFSLAMATRLQNPAISLRFNANQPVALATLADGQLQGGSSAKSLGKAEAMALQALQAQPLNARAARVLAFAWKGLKKDDVKASQLITLAGQASRRDLGTQIFLIEQAAAADNIPKALTHYDIALRTDRKASPMLFPVLSAAMSQTEIRRDFAAIAKRQPKWLMDFYEFHARNSKDVMALAAVLPKRATAVDAKRLTRLQTALIDRIFELEGANAAFQFYAAMPFFDKNIAQSAAISEANIDGKAGPFAWRLINQNASGANFVTAKKGAGQSISLFAAPGVNAAVAQKILYLPAGTYRISAAADLRALPRGSQISLILQCTAGAQMPILDLPLSAAQNASTFAIGSDCAGQVLAIRILGGNGSGDAQGAINSIAITKG
jgi:hypothetical protein